MLKKRIVILSGDISGALKIESLGDKRACCLTLTKLIKSAYVVIKIGAFPSVIAKINRLKTDIQLNNNMLSDETIVCLVVGDSHVVARGKIGKDTQYYKAEQDFDDYLANAVEEPELIESSESYQQDIIAKMETEGVPAGSDEDNAIEEFAISEDTDSCNIANAALLRTSDNGSQPFYIKVGDRLKELFSDYQHDEQLEAIVHSSQWVRVEYDDSNYYVVGLIKEDNIPLFICYGVPVDSKAIAHEESCHCEWLPVDMNDLDGKGYWVLYQDATTGETLT